MRPIQLTSLVVLGAVTSARAGEPAPDAPTAPWKEHRLVVPSLTCTVDLPPAWESGSPMPDHILELWIHTDAGFPLPALMVEEGDVAKDLPAAVKQYEERVKRSWAGDPSLRLVSEAPLEGAMRGVLVTFEKRPSKGAPVEPFQAAVFLVSGMTVHAMPSASSEARSTQLQHVFTTLMCKRKPR